MNSLEAWRGSRHCLRGGRMLRRREERNEGGGLQREGGVGGRRLLASFLGMKDIINVLGGGPGDQLYKLMLGKL